MRTYPSPPRYATPSGTHDQAAVAAYCQAAARERAALSAEYGRTVPSGAVVAVGRFLPNGPLGYRAAVPGAEIRPTRRAALLDWCAYYTASTR